MKFLLHRNSSWTKLHVIDEIVLFSILQGTFVLSPCSKQNPHLQKTSHFSEQRPVQRQVSHLATEICRNWISNKYEFIIFYVKNNIILNYPETENYNYNILYVTNIPKYCARYTIRYRPSGQQKQKLLL